MKDIVLYCKSYRRDFLRLKRLLDSIEKYNKDQIPFYISTPQDQHDELISVLGESSSYRWVSDEDIVLSNPKAELKIYKDMPGGLSQAIVKSEFWRLGVSENYLCLDSDGVLICDFYRLNFLSAELSPYTVLHQNKDYFQLATNRGKPKVQHELKREAKHVQGLFGRSGPVFYCAPSPFIWSAKVWQSLDENYLTPLGLTIWDLITPSQPETLIYGEAILKYRAVPIMAIEPLFRVYHYDWQYFLMRRIGETEDKLKENFLGVIYQSNWQITMDHGRSTKINPSTTLKKIKHFLRYLQSFTF